MTALPGRVERVLAAVLVVLIGLSTVGDGGADPRCLLIQHVLTGALLATWLLARRRSAHDIDPRIAYSLAVFVALACVGAAIAPYAFAALLVLLEIACFAVVMLASARSGPALWPGVAFACGVTALGQSAVALAQWLHGTPRPSGGFLNPNHLAAWLVATLFVVSGFAAPRGALSRAWGWGVAVASASALLLIGSRGALVGIAAGVVVVFLTTLHRVEARRRVRLVAIGVALLGLGATGVALRFRVVDPFATARASIWRAAARPVLRDPWFGTKPGQFETIAPALNFARDDLPLRFERSFSSPHSDLLRAPVEFGVPAALALFLALFLGVRAVTRRITATIPAPEWTGALAALAALGSQAVFDDLTETPALYVLAAVLCGGLWASRDEELAGGVRSHPARWAVLLLAGLVIAADVAAFRSWRVQSTLPRGSLDAAQRAALERAIRWNPLQPDLRIRRAEDRIARSGEWTAEDYAAAREDAEAAIRLNPQSPAPWRVLARVEGVACRGLFGDVATRERAVSAFREAEALAPHDPFLPLEASAFLLATGDPDGARRAAERALRIEPQAIPPRLVLARAVLDEGAPGAAAVAARLLEDAERIASRHAAVPRESPYAARLLALDPAELGSLRSRLDGIGARD